MLFALLILLPFNQPDQVGADSAGYRIVTGEVSYKGKPMIGETIIVMGTVEGVITDMNGQFCLIVPKG